LYTIRPVSHSEVLLSRVHARPPLLDNGLATGGDCCLPQGHTCGDQQSIYSAAKPNDLIHMQHPGPVSVVGVLDSPGVDALGRSCRLFALDMSDPGKKSFTDMLVSKPLQLLLFDGQRTSYMIRPVLDCGFPQIYWPTWGAHVAPARTLMGSWPVLNALYV